MKGKVLIFVLIAFTLAACKKNTSNSGAGTNQTTKTYSVKYKFTSNSNLANFDITYGDASGQHALTSQSSGWQIIITENAGTYCTLSATSHVSGASAYVEIDYDNAVLGYNTGSGTYATASCSGTLPN